MRTRLALLFLLAGASPVWAQFATGTFFASHDSDNFEEMRVSAGATADNGIGAAAGAMYYSAPGWSASGTLLVGTYKSYKAAEQIDANAGVARIDGRNYAVGGLDYLHTWATGNALGLSFERSVVNSRAASKTASPTTPLPRSATTSSRRPSMWAWPPA